MAVPIRNIELIVYPFYLKGVELQSRTGKAKCMRWIHDLQSACSSLDTAVVCIDYSDRDMANLPDNVSELRTAFDAASKELQEKGLFFHSINSHPQGTALDAVFAFEKIGFAPSVRIRVFGQHYLGCVSHYGMSVARALSTVLLRRHNVESVILAPKALSIKAPRTYVERRFGKPAAGFFDEHLRSGKKSVFSLRRIARK